jgi:hypothetical protein
VAPKPTAAAEAEDSTQARTSSTRMARTTEELSGGREDDAPNEPTFRRPKHANLACRNDKQPPQEVQEFDGWVGRKHRPRQRRNRDARPMDDHLNETFGPHTRAQSLRRGTRRQGPSRTTIFRETEPKDGRQEPSCPNNIEVEVTPKEERQEPSASRRPKAGRGPSRGHD